MALILGTNAYIDLPTFKSWCDLRTYDYSAKTDAEIEAAIVRSSVDFLDVDFDFKGLSVDEDQAMQLPTDEVSIDEIENGAAQAAWQELNGLLFVEQSTSSSSGQIKRKMDKLDVLETEVEYLDGTAKTYTYSTTKIRKMLSRYLAGGGGFKAQRA